MRYYDQENTILEEEFEHTKDHLCGLIDDIYQTGSIRDLEFHLEEVLAVFGLRLPKEEPMVMSKPQTTKISVIEQLASTTRQYADEIYN